MNRLRAWLAVTPLIAAGMLVAHAVAYRLTGTPGGSLHAYLEHAPQAVLLLSVLGIALAGLGRRLAVPPAWTFAAVAPLAFVVQEHLERLVHNGQMSWTLASPAFLLGLALQAPIAAVVWLVARRMVEAVAEARPPYPRVAHALLDICAPGPRATAPVPVRALPGRGPPPLLRP